MINPERGAGISIVTPYRDDHAVGRAVNWAWLRKFWEIELPCAQITVGESTGEVFSKAAAVNNGFQRSNPANDVIAMIDADCYISPEVILYCAARIREARRWNEKLFFVPYRHLYRLTEEATARLVASSPANALQFEIPHTLADVGSTRLAEIGHRYGALIQIFPREAFIEIGGMDPRFAGWGGEDVTLTRVLDTLYGIHETTANEVLTLWHTALGDVFLRKWAGQQDVGHNDKLSSHYRQARRDPERMRDVIDEWLLDPAYAEHRIEPLPEWHRHRHHHHHHHREPPPDGSI